MNKNKTYIGIKIEKGTVYGVERLTDKSKSGKRVYFEELQLSEQNAKVLKTALPVYRKIFFILPPEMKKVSDLFTYCRLSLLKQEHCIRLANKNIA